jgi:hypothetical protein
MFKYDQLSPLPITTVLQQERLRYSIVYDTILLFLRQHRSVYLGGTLGARLLHSPPLSPSQWQLEDFQIELYGEHMLNVCNELTNFIDETLSRNIIVGSKEPISAEPTAVPQLSHVKDTEKPNTDDTNAEPTAIPKPASDDTNDKSEVLHAGHRVVVVMKTSIPNGRYMIQINMRPMVTLIELPRGFASLVVGKPSHDQDISLLVEAAHLVDIYRILYQPRPGDWPAALDLEQLLQNSSITGGGGADRKRDEPRPADLRKKIWEAFVSGTVGSHLESSIIVGDYAIQALTNKPIEYKSVMHILSQQPAALAEALCVIVSGQSTHHPLSIMRDSQLERTIVRGSGSDLIYIFNTPTYELVGWCGVKGLPLRLGSRYLLLRFLYIDYWTITLRSANLDPSFYRNKCQSILDGIEQIKSSDIPPFVPPEQYMGVYISDEDHAKISSQTGNRFPDYFPRSYLRKEGAYRSLGKK